MTTGPALDRFTDRALNSIASMACGQEVRVALSSRIAPAAAVAAGGRTAVLDPARAGLYDLFLAARLLARRAEVKAYRAAPAVPEERVRRWVRADRAGLLRAFPRIARLLDGHYHPGRGHDDLPRVSWDEVEWTPLGPADRNGLGGRASLLGLPGVEVAGAGDDFTWLAGAIAAGRYPLEPLPELPELPLATCPLNLSFSQAYGPEYERLEATLNAYKDATRDLIGCYRRRSEGLVELAAGPRRALTGLHLDDGRLVDARVARASGHPARLFRRPALRGSFTFDPSRHLVVLAADLNALAPGPLGNPGWSRNALAISVKVYQSLGVDLAVVGFWDRVVDLPDGRRAYLHLPVPIKRPEDPVDGAFWGRLAHVMNHTPALPGEPACFLPALVRTVESIFDRADVGPDYHHRLLFLIAQRGMPADDPAFSSPEFHARTARVLESRVAALRDRHDGHWGGLDFCFIPRAVLDRARPGGLVARMSHI